MNNDKYLTLQSPQQTLLLVLIIIIIQGRTYRYLLHYKQYIVAIFMYSAINNTTPPTITKQQEHVIYLHIALASLLERGLNESKNPTVVPPSPLLLKGLLLVESLLAAPSLWISSPEL